jgi:hypothetical protein
VCASSGGRWGGGFIGSGGRGQGRPKGGQWWGPDGVQRPHRARRPRGHAGGVLSRLRSAVGRCWRGHGGRELAERKKERRGGPGDVLYFFPCRTAWVGAKGAGLDCGGLHEHGYMVETNGDSDAHSKLDFLRFLPAMCSTQCPQEIQI